MPDRLGRPDEAARMIVNNLPPISFGEDAPKPKPKPKPKRFALRRFGAIRHDAEADYRVKGLLCSTGLAVVWGAPKCCKSFWVFDLLMHVARGRSYRGHRVQRGEIVYCALEGQKGFERRIEAFRREKLADDPEADPPFYLMSTPLSLVRDVETLIADIKVQIGDIKPAAICVDTLNRSIEGSESSDADMSAYIRAADALRDAFGCLIIIVHHCGHEGQRPRGHSSLIGGARRPNRCPPRRGQQHHRGTRTGQGQ